MKYLSLEFTAVSFYLLVHLNHPIPQQSDVHGEWAAGKGNMVSCLFRSKVTLLTIRESCAQGLLINQHVS